MTTKFQFKSIKNRLTFWFLIVSLIPMIIVSAISYQERVSSIRKRAFEKLITIRTLKIDKLNSWLDQKIGDIRTMSEDPEVRYLEDLFDRPDITEAHRATIESAREGLKRFVKNYEDFREIYIINPVSGRIEVSTNKLFEGEDRSRNPYFTEALKTRDIYIKDIFYSKNLNIVSMTFSLPVFCLRHHGKHIVGILVARINLRHTVFDILLDRSGLGDTGETLIVNKDLIVLNELVNHPNAALNLKVETPTARFALKGGTGIIETTDYRGKQVLSAYGFIPGLEWGVVVKQDLDEINAPVREMLIEILLVHLCAIIGVCLVAVVLSRNISGPVLEMTSVSKDIQGGDLSARNTLFPADEFGFLSRSFNQMANTLKLQLDVQQAGGELSETMVKSGELDGFATQVLEKLIQVSDSNLGAFYVLDENQTRFVLQASSGVTPELMPSFDTGNFEGEFGKALASKEVTRISNIPEDTVFNFKTFSGTAVPREIITIPIVVRDQVMAVISLARLSPYSDKTLEVVRQPWVVGLNAAFSNILATEETKKLAFELRDKNRELEAQARQLQSQTRELRQKSDELRGQNVELQIKQYQVEEANRLKSQFLSNMSHELRTPLNSIMALSKVLTLQARAKITEEEADYLKIIERNGKNLLDLINDILDLSKIEADRMELNPKLFSPRSTVETLIETLEPIAAEKGIGLTAEFPQGFPRIKSDETRVYQILQNLMGNAVKFTDQGAVSIVGDYDKSFVHIRVSDTGIGIAEKHLPYIFEEFRQVDGSSARKYEGTGLGLAIAYKSAKMLCGDISAESTPGAGSTFTLTLPIQWPGGLEDQDINMVSDMPMPTGERTVLVVDDDPAIVTMICNVLADNGYHTISASSGREALRLAELYKPFAITLDIIMPEMDGWEVLQLLKHNDATKDIPVIIISITKDTETGFALGAVGYVTKPVAKEALLAEIHKIIRPNSIEPRQYLVMVADDNEFERNNMAQSLRKEGMNVVCAENGSQCISLIKENVPDVLVLDLVMPVMDGFNVLEYLRKDPNTLEMPVIIVTAKDLNEQDKARLSGNVSSILAKSATTAAALLKEVIAILSGIRKRTNFAETTALQSPASTGILLVEDNDVSVIQIKTFLENNGFRVFVARNGEDAIEFVNQTPPDGIILDLMMPGMDGFEVLETIRGTETTSNIPVLILTAKDLSSNDLKRLKTNNIQQLVQKGDIDQEGLLKKVMAMLGSPWGSAEKESGSTVTELPLVAPVTDQDPGESERSDGRPLILAVEDNPDNLITLRAVLKDRYDLIEAMDGRAGLAAVFEKRPDLVLLDMALPVLDGYAVATEVRKDAAFKALPILALTAQAMKGDMEKILEAGCDDYISKPFDPIELRKKIDMYLDKVKA